MPKRTDISTILLIGSGPIVIGQACEFDYSGTQACKALREEGYRVVLVNSNPATIMTDPQFADATYVEPLTCAHLEAIIEKEQPDAILPTVGGQTALNLALELHDQGILARHGVELIGANVDSIRKAEDRQLFKDAMREIGLSVPPSATVSTIEEAEAALATIGLPAVIRPAFTLGGAGGGIVHTRDEFRERVAWGLAQSPVTQVLLEQSVLGWKEFELEVMRDRADNVVIICSIENLDPMGVHTGDSITVAPAQTLTDKEYQRLRDAAIAIIREIGVDTGGSNVQFAINPRNGDMIVIEMNPRVSRSSALASKATGYPIAKIAAKLAIGYTLDELPNDITRETKASFEPSIDYVVTKIPRFTFEKFPGSDATLTTQMKSVGEVMAIGRTFPESLNKAVRSLEVGSHGLADEPIHDDGTELLPQLEEWITKPCPERLWRLAEGLRRGLGVEEIAQATQIEPWFIYQISLITDMEQVLRVNGLQAEELRQAKCLGFSDERIAQLCECSAAEVAAARQQHGVTPTYRMVDTCAAEFEAYTPYLYSTYDGISDDEALPSTDRKVLILGSGPNRIGQGVEFDYCCVQAVLGLREQGVEAIMLNCNPETVSTDYDIADRLYFEPLTFEDVMGVVQREQPEGVIVQFGGQTPLKLAQQLKDAGVKILGTQPEAIHQAEDRGSFRTLIETLALKQPPSDIAMTAEDAARIAKRLGYPVLMRPSYVLGGRAMMIVQNADELARYVDEAVDVSPEQPVLIDSYLDGAIEVDVDAICDGSEVRVVGIMEHIEQAGVHSGDSSCALPPYSLPDAIVSRIREQATALARAIGVVGMMNVQFAVKGDDIYVIEVNPRGSRTVPFVAKATGIPVSRIATRVMCGESLAELLPKVPTMAQTAVKSPVFPFTKFPGSDVILGPEMKSTGEVMGMDMTFAGAYDRAQTASGNPIPQSGHIFMSVRDEDKNAACALAREFIAQGFSITATQGTASALRDAQVSVETINKVSEGAPHVVDALAAGQFALVVNTTSSDSQVIKDSFSLRRTTLEQGVPYFTTLAATAAALAVTQMQALQLTVENLQTWHQQVSN